MWILPAIVVLVGAALAIRFLAETPRELDLTDTSAAGTRRGASLEPNTGDGAVASSGQEPPGAAAATSGRSVGAAVVKELETITGMVDGHELIGRRVDLRVPVEAAGAGNTTYWLGSGDNRLLAVHARDATEGGGHRAGSETRTHGVEPVNGRKAAVTGTIQRVPDAEERFSWRLTREEEEELLQRNIYVRAERVVAEGHGE